MIECLKFFSNFIRAMMTMTSEATISPDVLAEVASRLDTILLGKPHQIRLALACLIARGHLLLEDLPGMGKTVLAHALARTLGLDFNRVQFTNDMLPGDLTGAAIFDRERNQFVFHPGPIFTQLLLADEINRASPKTQSALLEAMEERQVSSEGTTRLLPEPFFVIATQNPVDHLSTNPLPEAQLDRFLMRLSLGYPDAEAELEVLRGGDRRQMLETYSSLLDTQQLTQLQNLVRGIHASEALLRYIRALAEHTRHAGSMAFGLSPRATLALLAAGRAWALLAGRDHVLPSDIQTVFPHVAMHRLGHGDARSAEAQAQSIIESVPVP